MKRLIPASVALALIFLCANYAIAVAGAISITHEVYFNSDPPGGQVLLVDHGRIVYEKNFGVRDLQTKQPVDEHTRFEIGSITKQFAAAAILQLQERGKLSLDDPLGKYVPQYVTGKHVTIKQLLWQVSGIPDYTQGDAYWKRLAESNGRVFFPRPLDLPKVLALVAHHPLRFKPGTKWEYSNTNYFLLGAVVEAVSGLSWEEYVRRNIYSRAGMTESSFMSDESSISDMATGYTLLAGSRTPVPVSRGGDLGGADGNIVSTARDLARWDAALFGGKVVSHASLAMMTAPGPRSAGPSDYGFGWGIDRYDGVRRLSHAGGTLGFASNTDVYPAISQDVIVLTSEFAYPAFSFGDRAFGQHNPALVAQSHMPVAGEDPTATAIVRSLWTGIMKGPLDRGMFTDRFSNFMKDNNIANFRKGWEPLGHVETWVYRGTSRDKQGESYTYDLLFSGGAALEIQMVLNGARKIDALAFRMQ